MKKKIDKDYEKWTKSRAPVESILKAIYEEYFEHKSCGFYFECIMESDTLWKKLKKILQAAREEGKIEERERAVKIIQGFTSRLAPEGELLYELHENIKYHFKKTIKAIEGDAKGGAHNEN